jgi:nucleoside-diphosphate-sugar epimerase
MRVFLAGATGAMGRALLPLLLQEGHDVVALIRPSRDPRELENKGVRTAVADPLDRAGLTAAIEKARPEIILHQLTALASVRDLKHLGREFALTNRFRIEATDTMLAAARASGAGRFIAQSFCGWPYAREGGAIKTEEDPLDPDPPADFGEILGGIRHLEEAVLGARQVEALALRYGVFYGPGTGITTKGPMVEILHKRRFPIVGEGGGVWSFIQIEDAARATVAALSRGAPGIFNVVDDEPAPVSEWLPVLAEAVGAPSPMRVPAWLARFAVGDGGVMMATESRGGSNAKAKRELGWRPNYESWRRGFREGLG